MKKFLKYSYFLIILSVALLLTAALLFKTNTILATVFAVIGACFFLAYAFLEPTIKKEKMKEETNRRLQNEKSENGALETHKEDNDVTKVIYSIYKGEIPKIKEILDNSTAEVEFDYDNEENMYSLGITCTDINNKKNPIEFMMVLFSADDERKLIVDDEEDISKLSYQELVDKVVKILKDGIVPYELKSFEIKRPQSHKNLGIAILAFSIIASIVIVVLLLTKTLELSIALAILIIPALFLALGIIQLILCANQRFIYDGKEFKYITFNKKELSCRVSDVERVYFNLGGKTLKIIFMGKDGNELLKFTDDGFIAKDKRFAYSLIKNKIKCDTVFI